MATLLELQADVYATLGQPEGEDNLLVTPALVRRALAEAHVWVAAQTGIYTRRADIAAAAGQATYALPADVADLETVLFGGGPAPLAHVTKAELEAQVRPGWRTAASGTPTAWYRDGDRLLGLYPPPAAAAGEAITLFAWVIPYAAGGGIAAITRADGVLTVTTAAAHGLRPGDEVAVRGVADTGFDGEATVATTPDAVTFTAAQAGADGESAGGAVGYAGGVLPLLDDADVPAFFAGCHDILSRRAALTLATTVLANDPHAQTVAPICARLVNDGLADLRYRVMG